MKTCTQCKSIKGRDGFYRRARSADGLQAHCITCHRDRHLNDRYALTPSAYSDLAAAQEGGCAICGDAESTLCVDHCHHSGRVRGLLCAKCNRGLGLLGDDAERLRSALDYLLVAA